MNGCLRSGFILVLGLGLAACVGPSGSDGATGATGDTGPQGPQGPPGPRPSSSTAWRFGVISDTQWTLADDGRNPNSVAVDIISQVNRAFMDHDVQLVVAVGDLADLPCSATPCAELETRAVFAQDLYNHGIAFYPLLGNHDPFPLDATEFLRLFPQTQTGVNNATPPDDFQVYLNSDLVNPVAKAGPTFTAGSGFSSPSSSLAGLSYAFDFRNVRFVLLDQFLPGDESDNTIDAQQPWITERLAGRPAGTHAFVFGHKGLITDGHPDNLFGDDPSMDPAGQDAFVKSLADNGVHLYVGGHDHMHLHEIVSTSDGTTAKVHELVCASDSSKFYTPFNPSIDEIYNVPAFGHRLQQRIAEELYNIGFYIVTIDGPNATIDYYGVPTGFSNAVVPVVEWNIATTPPLTGHWMLHDTFGYSLKGREFVVPQGASYTVVSDTFGSTAARILAGDNGSLAVDPVGNAPLIKAVDTGWSERTDELDSDVLWLWGLADPGSDVTDTYVLSMTFSGADPGAVAAGKVGITTPDANGNWVNAVQSNVGGTPAFVAGPWTAGAPLGAYGVDVAAGNAWAVVNRAGAFAVAKFQ